MARPPKLPEGVSLYKDRGGSGAIYRVRLGKKFLGSSSKPVKRAFTAHAEAVDWIRSEKERLYGKPIEIDGISAEQIAEVRVAMAKLEGKATLVEAADAWLNYVKPFRGSPTIKEVAAKVVAAKKASGIGDEYADELAGKFALYLDGFLEKKMSDFREDDVETILNRPDKRKKKPSQAQRAKRLRFLRILVRFALRKGWVRGNPLSVDPPKVERHPVVVLSPVEVARLLIATQESVPEFLAALAIKLFGGPRNTEIMKLDWDALGEGELTLPAAFTKTLRLRGFEIHPTLASWLDLCECEQKGKILKIPDDCVPKDFWQKLLKRARLAAGFEKWPQNALRHAFCSYHYGLHKDEDLTAAIAGNSPAVIKANYLNAVKKRDCERFWRLTPAIAEALASSSVDTNPVSGSEEEPEPPPEF